MNTPIMRFSLASAAECGAVYEAMRSEALLPTVVYDGDLSREDFVALVGHGIMVRMTCGMTLLGAAWLRDIHAATASLHFCFFKAGRAEARVLGRACLRHMFSISNFQSLYGITPKPYRAAVAYITAVGGRVMGEVAGACVLHHRGGRIVPAIISTFNRKEYV
ncbi:MAG: hypothetical protein RRY29_10535 [Desulfovibrionaceae bacterium]